MTTSTTINDIQYLHKGDKKNKDKKGLKSRVTDMFATSIHMPIMSIKW